MILATRLTLQIADVQQFKNFFARGTSYSLSNPTALIHCPVSQGERASNASEPSHQILAPHSARSPVRARNRNPVICSRSGDGYMDQGVSGPGASRPCVFCDGLRSYQQKDCCLRWKQ